jgi:general L-amino acid transport system permease protein
MTLADVTHGPDHKAGTDPSPELMHSAKPPPQRGGPLAGLVAWWGPRPWSQIAVILGIAALLVCCGSNIAASLARSGIHPGFGFLSNTANFQIGETPITFRAGDSYLRAIMVGMVNTLRVAVVGCLLATLFGVIMGILSLSGNPLVTRLVRIYVEIIRNTPLLLQLFFWIALLRSLPGPKQALGGAGFYLSNRGIFLPWVEFGADGSQWQPLPPGAPAVTLVLIAAIILSAWQLHRSDRRSDRARLLSGNLRPDILWAAVLALSILELLLMLNAAQPMIDIPAIQGFNIRGGLSLSPEYAALWDPLGAGGPTRGGPRPGAVRGSDPAAGGHAAGAAGDHPADHLELS